MVQHRGTTAAEPARVRFDGHAVACRPTGQPVGQVEVVLVGGSGRYSVAGQPGATRWWRGELKWVTREAFLPCGSEVRIELDDGRAGIAVIEPAPAAEEDTVVIRGIGPPPFDLPSETPSSAVD